VTAAPVPGLSSEAARRRLARDGPNEIARRERFSAARELATLVTNPLIVILLLASAVSAAVGEVVNATVIVAMVAMGTALSFVQTYRSQRAASALRALVAPLAHVQRDGAWVEIPHRELVIGDLIRLSAGDLVPADAELREERELHVQEAVLTGESVPAEKAVGDVTYAGTSVVTGFAVAEVVRTGGATAFGRIAASLSQRPPETEFERGTRAFGVLIMRTVFFFVLFVLLVNIALHRDPLETLLFAIALAMGLTPEYLPMIMTVTLAQGAVRMSREGVIVKRLASIQDLGSIDVLCSDKTNTLTSGALALERAVDAAGVACDEPLRLGALNSAYETGIASPLDAAILARERPDPARSRKIDEIPFDFIRRRTSVVVECDRRRLLVTKGAPEGVLDVCVIAADAREGAMVTYRALSADGFRVLAVGSREIPEQAAYGPEDEHGLAFAGFLAFADPPLEGVGDVVRALLDDGVELKILSGDNELVTRHVCERIGIDPGPIVVGSDLDRIDEARLPLVAEATRAFARVTPDQKERVIRALKRRGHVVGFLGDGVNDAPSLHSADIGISVMAGVDVAKDAADVILRSRSLAVLHTGIVAGRRSFGNVVKYLLMGTSSSFGNVLSMAAASLFLPFLPMMPRQILVNDFLYDVSQIAIPTDNVDPSFTRKPRRWDMKLVWKFMLVLGPVSSAYDLLTFGALIFVFGFGAAAFQTGWFIESLATQTLVLLVIRTAADPLRNRPSRPLFLAVLAALVVGLVLPYSPFATALGFVPLPPSYYAFVVAVVATYLGMVELLKHRIMSAA
jgi:Mg2+-importing ATPase